MLNKPKGYVTTLSDEKLNSLISNNDSAIIVDEQQISKESVNLVYRGNLYLSQTATDAFANCPFAFHCKYTLKLKERNNSRIERSDVGTLVHSILQTFIEDTKKDSTLGTEKLSANDISKRIADITSRQSALILDFTPENKKARVSYMLKRLAEITTHTAINLFSDLMHSVHKPKHD